MKREHDHFGLVVLAHVLITMFFKRNGITYFSAYLYQIFTFCSCVWLLQNECDFSILQDEKNATGKKILKGAVYGFSFACIVIAFCMLVFGLKIYPQYLFKVSSGWILNQIVFQLFVALGEEILYRFYLYEKLLAFGIPKWISVVIVSSLFGYVHIYLHGGWFQAIIAFLFSIFVFVIKRREGNSYFMLVAIHLTYNLCYYFSFLR